MRHEGAAGEELRTSVRQRDVEGRVQRASDGVQGHRVGQLPRVPVRRGRVFRLSPARAHREERAAGEDGFPKLHCLHTITRGVGAVSLPVAQNLAPQSRSLRERGRRHASRVVRDGAGSDRLATCCGAFPWPSPFSSSWVAQAQARAEASSLPLLGRTRAAMTRPAPCRTRRQRHPTMDRSTARPLSLPPDKALEAACPFPSPARRILPARACTATASRR